MTAEVEAPRPGRAEPRWVDRLGRAFGFAWVATIPVQVAFEVIWPLGSSGKL